jgi:hypothetical protein
MIISNRDDDKKERMEKLSISVQDINFFPCSVAGHRPVGLEIRGIQRMLKGFDILSSLWFSIFTLQAQIAIWEG